jgi:NAD(P)-dependent dehydrogenase (short-subunit alcohol dehydrogenase family)
MTDDVRPAFVDRQPMGRLGTPEEVVALALFRAPTSRATSRARRIWWMAGWRCKGPIGRRRYTQFAGWV